MAVVMKGGRRSRICKRKNVPGGALGLDTRRDDMKARFSGIPVQRLNPALVLDRPGEYSKKVVRGNLLSIEEYLALSPFIQRGAAGRMIPSLKPLSLRAHPRDVFLLPSYTAFRTFAVSPVPKRNVSVSDFIVYRVTR